MLRQREARKPVVLPVRIRMDSGWHNAQIRNVSSRGLMLVMKDPPVKGSFIEIRRGTNIVIVGQVRWSGPDRCGIRSQDKIDVAFMTSKEAKENQARKAGHQVVERRATARVLSPEEVAERSRQKSQLMQRLFLIGGVVAAALFLASLLFDVLSVPLDAITKHL
ncbi:MAG: PilZ domain-containing protein [Sphingobium sp.]